MSELIVNTVPIGIGIRMLVFVALVLSSCTSSTGSPSTPQPSATTPTPVGTPSVSATPRATDSRVSYENPYLGYRIALPNTYRRLTSTYFIADTTTGGLLGTDAYTLLTEQQEHDECLQDLGDLPPRSANMGLFIETFSVEPAVSASNWASTPLVPGSQPLTMHRRVEPLAIPGFDAIKLVADNASADTQVVIIHAGDRMYELSATMWPSPHHLEDIAATFATVARQPLPTPSPTPAPDAARAGATALAVALARAFTVRDASAVARLMPDCRISVSPVIDGADGLPNSGGGGVGRSIALFTQALQQRFAAGDLSVTMASVVELDAHGSYFVRSDWKVADRTTPIDLVLGFQNSEWRWVAARHHFTRAELGNPPCIPYRSPWVDTTAHC